MPENPGFDTEKAHKFFSTGCFNKAWELIEKPDRTAAEDEEMIQLAHASLWHWSQRPDCTAKNLSIGYWQLSRIYAILGDGSNARKSAQTCLEKTPRDDAFLVGYAHEALARAEFLAGNSEEAREHLAEAFRQAEKITEAEDKEFLLKDLQGHD